MNFFWSKLVLTSSLLCCSLFTAIQAKAQVTSDNTVNTIVNQNGNVSEITGGQTQGNNLFHSFQEFSVPTDNIASFNNADAIENIFSRVTGGNISNIDGAIRANNANLFLINPAGIIFGENASLNIGGSFYGSTADSILFPDDEFSAVNNLGEPILTINAPIGLNFRDNPQPITNRSVGNGLQVATGENITLVGGNVDLDGGMIFAPSGRVELGGLSAAGEIGINADGSLSFPDGIERADVTLTQEGRVSASTFAGTLNAGEINITTANLSVTQGSVVDANTLGEGNAEGNAGAITIEASDTISVDGGSIVSEVGADTVCNGGGINLTTTNLYLRGGGQVSASTFGQGNAGGINLTTTNLYLSGGGQVSASTFGQGNGGAIEINASSGTISIDGANSGIFSQVGADVAGNVGEGNAGDINLSTANLSLTQGGVVTTSTFGRGDGGAITINASETISADGAAEQTGFQSGISSLVGADAAGNVGEGNAGGINLSTANLSLTQGGVVNNSTFGQGNGGAITITSDRISVEGANSGISSLVGSNAVGNAGGINLTTANLSLTQEGVVNVSAFGEGNAGSVTVEANSVFLDNNANINAATQSGEGGIINLQITEDLTLRNNSTITAQAFGTADGGNIDIDADFIIAFPSQFNGNDILASAEQGIGGNINITAEALFGIEERPLNSQTNDINASSEFSLDGTISITTPDLNPFQGIVQLPSNVVEPGQTVVQACQSDYATRSGKADRIAGKASGLTIKGKGNIPPKPTEPFIAEPILVNGKISTPDEQAQHTDIKSIKTSIGDIFPARGIIETEDGQIILTAYPTEGIDTRTPDTQANCTQS